MLERAGQPPLRRREGGFAGLAQIIVGQQVSTASAAAIHGRLVAIADPFDHTCVLRARKDRLLRVGLSNAKVKTLKEIAKAIEAKHIDLHALADMPADDAHAALVALHGIGPWTADIYLLACLGHADAGRPAISPCRKPRASRSACARARPRRRWSRSPNAGGRIARWRRGCCGPTIAR